jgi:hypothetical protein
MKVAFFTLRRDSSGGCGEGTMKIDSVKGKDVAGGTQGGPQRTKSCRFSRYLNREAADKNPAEYNSLERFTGVKTPQQKAPAEPKRILLGTISAENPTVSNLLKANPHYERDTWRIVHSEENRDKPYTQMRPGTNVYLDPESFEVVWDYKGAPAAPASALASTGRSDNAQRSEGAEKGVNGPMANPGHVAQPERESLEGPEHVLLGELSPERPTVSDLLEEHPVYGKDTWRIVYSERNRAKPFTRIRPGTKIWLNTETLELAWGRADGRPDLSPNSIEVASTTPDVRTKPISKVDSFSEKLVNAVKPYMGATYEELDCFELLVQGLEKLGIRYGGRGGLGEHLVKTAVGKGLPWNAYLNGEGLIQTSGSQIYSKSISRIRDIETQARHLFTELEPLLEKGFILSFSTPTRGHTGIISQSERLWTFINSGDMDHRVGSQSASKGVGEESLTEEIRNWVRLAADRKEPLLVTLGRLVEEKLRSVMIPGRQAANPPLSSG